MNASVVLALFFLQIAVLVKEEVSNEQQLLEKVKIRMLHIYSTC